MCPFQLGICCGSVELPTVLLFQLLDVGSELPISTADSIRLDVNLCGAAVVGG